MKKGGVEVKRFNIEVLSNAMANVLLLEAKLKDNPIMSLNKRIELEKEIAVAEERVNHIRRGMGLEIY